MARYSEETRARYRELLHLREAEKRRVHADGGLALGYELDGTAYELTIE